MDPIYFVDVTLRDGQMSLWATNMTTNMMLPIVQRLDEAGFLAVEVMSSASFKKCIRELRDDPFERVRLVAQRMQRSRLRSIRSRYMAGLDISPYSVAELWVQRLAAAGIRELRSSDPSNAPWSWEMQVRMARTVGIDTVVNVIYTISPRHTDAYYADRVRAAAELRPFRICLKDPGGLLTPDRTGTLVQLFLENSNGIPVELHTHCNTGLGPLCMLEGIKAGIRIVNTAIPPLANASSLPSVYNVAGNARTLGYAPQINLDPLAAVTEHFTAVAQWHGLPLGVPLEYDEYHYRHQVPGGMISNLRHQLAQMGVAHRLQEVLEETVRVRAEFGYPIMVTPYSQFVGSQAAINIMTGERYGSVPDQVIQYVLGHWGQEESESVAADVRDRILDRPRARELAAWEPWEPSLREFRAALGPGLSDDDLILHYLASAADVTTMRALGPKDSVHPKTGAQDGSGSLDVRQPVAALVVQIGQRPGIKHFVMQRREFTLRLHRPADQEP